MLTSCGRRRHTSNLRVESLFQASCPRCSSWRGCHHDHRLQLGRLVVRKHSGKRADEASRSAVVAVLAPICVDKFQHAANATDNLIELKKVSSYMQGNFVEKGGWATSPGTDKANSAVAQACATMLGNLK